MTLSRGYLGIANASADKCKETNECSNLNKQLLQKSGPRLTVCVHSEGAGSFLLSSPPYDHFHLHEDARVHGPQWHVKQVHLLSQGALVILLDKCTHIATT